MGYNEEPKEKWRQELNKKDPLTKKIYERWMNKFLNKHGFKDENEL